MVLRIILVYLTIFCTFDLTKSSQVHPENLDEKGGVAEVVETSSCCYFCKPIRLPLMKTMESDGESIEAVESESDRYRIFETPAHSISFETLGMLHGAEDNLWHCPESPFLKLGQEPSEKSKQSKKFDHPLLKDIEGQLERLKLDYKEPKENSVSKVLSDENLLYEICSFLPDNFMNLRMVNKRFHKIEEMITIKRFSLQFPVNSLEICGLEANLFLSQIVKVNEDELLDQFVKRGLSSDKKIKFLLLTEVFFKLKLLKFEDIKEMLISEFKEVCNLGLKEIFMSIRKFENEFYRKEIQKNIFILIEKGKLKLFEIAFKDLKDEKLKKFSLLAAVQFNQLEIVKFLVEIVPIEVIPEVDRNALMLAIELGHFECLKALFKDKNDQKTSRGMSISHFAVKFENQEILQFLLAKKVFEENYCDLFERTALHFAAAFSSPQTLETILKYQQKLESFVVYPLVTCDTQGQIPLHYAAAVGNVENTKLLLNYIDHSVYYPYLNRIVSDNDERFGFTLIRNPSKVSPSRDMMSPNKPSSPDVYRKLRFFRSLYSKEKTVENLLKESDGAVGTPLHIAAKNGHLEIVKILLEALPQLINWKDEFGRNAFLVAVIHGNDSIVAYFLQRITNGNMSERSLLQMPDSLGSNGLHFAIKFNYESIFDMLLVSHFYSLHDRDGRGFTPLQLAEFYGRDSMVRKLKSVLPEYKKQKKNHFLRTNFF